jgi:uncharacterized Zn-finger protein
MSNPQSAVQPNQNPSPPASSVEIAAADLPLHCPMPGSPLWNSHPRVFLPIDEAPQAADGSRRMRCPYCGTEYVLREA